MREETEIAVYATDINNAKYDNSVKMLFGIEKSLPNIKICSARVEEELMRV